MADEQTVQEYEMLWRNKFLTTDARTIDDLIVGLADAAQRLRDMKAAGVRMDAEGAEDDYARLITTDPNVADKFGFELVEMEEFEDSEDEDDDEFEKD